MNETHVFTNGCFDLLHVGHVRLLQWARAQGTRLTVGLNSDESLRRLKGPGRPLTPQADRAEILRALRWVDNVLVFEEDTPLALIQRLQPQVLVKGPDYRGRAVIVGRECVEALGGRVLVPDWPVTVSTRHLISALGG